MAPNISRLRRPHFSTIQRPGKVEQTLIILVIRVMVKPLEIPEFSKKVVP
jgi:hypothetical protein